MTRGGRERGAAVADFALVSGLLALLFVAMLQLGYVLHVRNTATAHAVEGARLGARADRSPADGAARTEALLATTLQGRGETQVSAARATLDSGVVVVQVRVSLPLPLVGPLGPPGTMEVTGHAYAEDQ